jgi:hypothetical protein
VSPVQRYRLGTEAVNKRPAGDTPSLDVRLTDRSPCHPLVGSGSGPTLLVGGAAADVARWLTRRETRGVKTAEYTPLPGLGPWL